MIPRALKIYTTTHEHSQVICRALALGSGGQVVSPDALLTGPGAVYGILRGCDRIIRESERGGQEYFHVDHGYFGRGHYAGYYRISRNALQWSGNCTAYPSDRWRRLGMPLQDWRKSGSAVIVCPPSKAIGEFFGVDPFRWTEIAMRELARHTDRPIQVKPKDSAVTFAEVLKDAWAVVVYNSNAATEAIVAGVPAFVLGQSAARPMAECDLGLIETPRYPERERWAHGLAYQQFRLEEIRRGECWEWL